MKDPMERFWSYVDKTPTCWLWTGGKTGREKKYGQFFLPGPDGRKMRMAHRVAYEALVGPIPAGLCIDHLCRVKGCVNPAHLEVVTLAENSLRSDSPRAVLARQTHCKRGHPFNGAFMEKGRRVGRTCRICAAAYAREHRAQPRCVASSPPKIRTTCSEPGCESAPAPRHHAIGRAPTRCAEHVRRTIDYVANGAAGKGHLAS